MPFSIKSRWRSVASLTWDDKQESEWSSKKKKLRRRRKRCWIVCITTYVKIKMTSSHQIFPVRGTWVVSVVRGVHWVWETERSFNWKMMRPKQIEMVYSNLTFYLTKSIIKMVLWKCSISLAHGFGPHPIENWRDFSLKSRTRIVVVSLAENAKRTKKKKDVHCLEKRWHLNHSLVLSMTKPEKNGSDSSNSRRGKNKTKW